MDLANDILRLAAQASQVPGLSMACSLAMQIMKTVQISKSNTARLQYLAHSVVDNLIAIAEHMDGKWDGATDVLKGQLDVFEGVLRDISKHVTRQAKASPVIAFINAGDRDMAIRRLEQRLSDARTSILMLLGVDASLSLQSIKTGVDLFTKALQSQAFCTDSQLQRFGSRFDQVQVSLRSQGQLVEDTYSRVVRLEDAVMGQRPVLKIDSVNTEVPLYGTYDLRILQTISRTCWRPRKNGHRVTVTLKEAQHRTSGQVVLVRTFESFDPDSRDKMFSRGLSERAAIWEPTILHLVGSSAPTSAIPFHVYDAPGGQVESFDDWLNRTLFANPIETVCGLYDMRKSLQALIEFQADRNVACWSPFIDSVVNAQTRGDRLSWTLIFTGEIEHGHASFTVHDQYRFIPPVTDADTPAWSILKAFHRGSQTWTRGAPALDALSLSHTQLQPLSLPSLAVLLLENGWLGPNTDYLPVSMELCLGDVGYTSTDGEGSFVVVGNVYEALRGGAKGKKWSAKCVRCPDDEAVESRECYKRYERREGAWCEYTLHHVNLDEKHAWKVLQSRACEIVARYKLSISPHDLKLVTSATHYVSFETRPLDSHSQTSSGYSKPVSDSQQLDIQDKTSPPTYYIFEGDAVHTTSGVPVLRCPRVQASFHAESEWVDECRAKRTCRREVLEICTGYELSEYRRCSMEYLQLPPGVACPYAEAVGDS